jgi:hypothetical protein
MAYKYDIFLSYARESPFGDWVHETFLPLFKPHLKAALNKDPKIFYDAHSVPPNAAWPAYLRKALGESRYLIAILSPQYFMSTWCKYEFGVIHYRGTQLGLMTAAKPNGLIIGINIRDEQHFPKAARELEWEDFRPYLLEQESFRKTEEYCTYQRKLIDWSDEVATVIKRAPRWKKEWLSDGWNDAAIRHAEEVCRTKRIRRRALWLG